MKRLGFVARLGAVLAAPFLPTVTRAPIVARPLVGVAAPYVVRVAGFMPVGQTGQMFRSLAAGRVWIGAEGESNVASDAVLAIVRGTPGAEKMPEWADRFELWTDDGRIAFQGSLRGAVPSGWDDLAPQGWIAP